ncbi:MAG: tRNA (5-methylaminomethyl-2-thiouridine)(34)-methyltransferase MnmD [Paludibacteraceae bacterium]|nr:tRNA (5-methylaminomethyl-2-thiouridine)(34)-methyltransferase MnmD [Paludibacteraceae bacterium]
MTLPHIEIQTTADGSSTLYRPDMDEHYHSTNGAITEAEHVYIKHGLFGVKKSNVSVLEIGFGTGLNAILTYVAANCSHLPVDYTTCELYPLPMETISQLNYKLPSATEKVFEDLHSCPWNEKYHVSPHFTFTKLHTDLTTLPLSGTYDVVYFDAFAPEKQPDMWTEEIFRHIYEQITPGGVLVTYCAKGVIRRMLQSVGFTTERLPGPPGKREMLRARKATV